MNTVTPISQAERLARELCRTARYYTEHHVDAATMLSSAVICLTDAEAMLEQRRWSDAYRRATRSLRYTVGFEAEQFCRESDDAAMTTPERWSRNTSGYAGHEWRHPCTGQPDAPREP